MNDTMEKTDVIIRVFKTNVDRHDDAQEILTILNNLLNPILVTFDLEDCDRILRVEGRDFIPAEVERVLELCGFQCELLL
ncbi:hypothetical protein SAMN05660862_1005 [Sphingobacterium psychroaquaticum]|uniref:Heavy-metal-associated domain-containing protein n=1 Tax=Sphingobacterium psychroaquaticum TaxID=561061 RepID=A0A1X7IMI1_9SPHI|nr:hypothetical protein SAMN05660862_1005 [Sphingobacterium psychroaquaticum]